MPIYEYRCDACGFQKEHLQKVSDVALNACPSCGAESYRKLLTTPGIQLKGGGYYATDFKGGACKPAESKSDGPPSPACGTGACPACQ
ncbi:MAG: zinc ribbon domain-containing protein [Betaproteobacteria bacterium]|nr:zinc ribbon domain-containing protein [Betaproteobacteria bacterium]